MDGDDKENIPSIFILPVELLVYILSFLPTCDRVKLPYVSWKLRNICETPSLWKDFVWPCYHAGDDNCVNNVLKMYGKYVKRMAFYHGLYCVESKDVPAQSQLLNSLEHCVNLTELSLPTIQINLKQLRKISLHIQSLQRLDVYCNDIPALLKAISVNLKELTIRKDPYPYWNGEIIGPWIDYWTFKKFTPQKINIITSHSLWLYGSHSLRHNPFHHCMFDPYPPNTVPLTPMLKSWIESNSKSPAGHTGTVKLYGPLKNTLNLAPIYPVFELTFGTNAASPFVSASGCGLHWF